jgi:hypothetical protein
VSQEALGTKEDDVVTSAAQFAVNFLMEDVLYKLDSVFVLGSGGTTKSMTFL